jgi:SNF2 family DNA or RNA helicase
MSTLIGEVYPAIPREKRPAWDHQRAAYWFVWRLWLAGLQGAMLAMDMGTGKSKVALDLAGALGPQPILILCPLRVVEVWEQQLKQHASFPYVFAGLDDRVRGTDRKALIARDTLAQARQARYTAVVAINYESMWLEPFASLALTTVWGLIIADECHRCKSPSGKQSRFLGKLALRAHKRLGLSGTPFPHSPHDIWAQYRFLDRSIYDPTYTGFKTRYAIFGGFENRVVKEWRDLDDLKQKFYSIAFRVEAKDVLDLPEEMDQQLFCTLSGKARRIYEDLERDFITWLDGPEDQITVANAMVLLLRLQQVTSGTLKDDAGQEHQIDTAKEDLLADWLEDVNPEEAVVVFALFHADLDAIARVCEKLERPYFECSGRIHQVAAWKAAKGAVLIAQIQAAGEGQDFTHARLAAYYSTGFRLGNYLQSRKRIHRPGQTRPVVYYHLLVKNTIDEIVLRAIERRWDLVETVMRQLKSCPIPPPPKPIWS